MHRIECSAITHRTFEAEQGQARRIYQPCNHANGLELLGTFGLHQLFDIDLSAGHISGYLRVEKMDDLPVELIEHIVLQLPFDGIDAVARTSRTLETIVLASDKLGRMPTPIMISRLRIWKLTSPLAGWHIEK